MSSPEPPRPADAAASALCQRCGLCCDGSLFTQVPLTSSEIDPARRRGLTVLARKDGSHALHQPCAALVERRCKIYDERPASCQQYRCMLLAALAAGEVTPNEAAALVDETHARLVGLAMLLPPSAEGAVHKARAAAHTGELVPAAHTELQRVRSFLDRHFRGRGRA